MDVVYPWGGENISPQVFQLVLQADAATLWMEQSEQACLGTHAFQRIRRIRKLYQGGY